MANPEHLRIARQGTEKWNAWRYANEKTIPDLSGADLREAQLDEAFLGLADLNGADLSGATLNKADLRQTALRKAILEWADLRAARCGGADFTGATLFQANLRRADLGAIFIEANFSRADLREAKLQIADMRGANLQGANLISAVLHGADLSKADLSKADLIEADFKRAILKGADVGEANLEGANLAAADLTGTNFCKAKVGWTSFVDVDLSVIRGLEYVVHTGPSHIGINTIYRSQGKIPAQFLRGAGVPDNFIEFMCSLTGSALEFYSCFISYSSKDQDFADRLFADLQHNGVRCWFAPPHVKAGEKLHEQIDTAIRLHERLLLILSPHSINSEWVKTEIAKARKREVKEGKRVLFPISLNISYQKLQEWECFDADTGKDLGKEIREYFIPDFAGWKDHDQYEEAFKKLLRDLKKQACRNATA